MGNYKQLILMERKQIKDGLDAGESIRQIANSLGRAPSTISNEVKINRTPKTGYGKLCACRQKHSCTKTNICKSCINPGMRCADCPRVDCRKICLTFDVQSTCEKLSKSPYVCNGCSKNSYGCHRSGRYIYAAKAADELAKTRRSESRIGIDMSEEKAALALPLLKDALLRGLSPYEISVSYAEEVGRHPSTIYRWIERGYGDTANIMLERKVGFKPRAHSTARKSTSHSSSRAYSEFLNLSEDTKAACTELDSVEGLRRDKQALLSVYLKQVHIQLYLLEGEKTCDEVKRVLRNLCSIMDKKTKDRIFFCSLTDNGSEFEDEIGIAEIIGEKPKQTRLYYCDPRQSQQKGACEKNHTELRQILPKGMFSFDELVEADLSVIMSHVNSNPRMSLGGLSPIEMFLAAYKDGGQNILDTLGVELINRDNLMLKPEILNIERRRRGEDPLTKLK